MTIVDIVNILIALASIGFGCAGWLAPGYTMNLLDMKDTGSGMGVSEVRAASGALFVGAGIGALILWTPAAFAMLGFAWGGAAIGRLTSLIVEGRTSLKLKFFATEAAIGVLGIWLNLA
jgi:hypothetical protein